MVTSNLKNVFFLGLTVIGDLFVGIQGVKSLKPVVAGSVDKKGNIVDRQAVTVHAKIKSSGYSQTNQKYEPLLRVCSLNFVFFGQRNHITFVLLVSIVYRCITKVLLRLRVVLCAFLKEDSRHLDGYLYYLLVREYVENVFF